MNADQIKLFVKIAMVVAKHGAAISQIVSLVIALVNSVRADLAIPGAQLRPIPKLSVAPAQVRAVAKALKAGDKKKATALLTEALA